MFPRLRHARSLANAVEPLNRFPRVLLECQPVQKIHLSAGTQKTVPTNLKGKTKASQEWLTRHLNDPYVKKAKELNYRARSAFKLIEIDDKFKFLIPGITVVEYGAAPGAWTQVAVERINSDGRDPEQPVGKIVAVDLLPIEPIPGAILFPGSDFTDPETRLRIMNAVTEGMPPPPPPKKDYKFKNQKPPLESPNQKFIDLILSDMAPNASGMGELDHSKICGLVSSCLQFAHEHGKTKSHFLAKVWDGSELKNLERVMKTLYKKVSRVKPKSSREESAETFLIGICKLDY